MNPHPTAGQKSDIETPYLRMTLDHDSGEMEGVVLQGRYAGAPLDQLSEPQLLDLFDECSLRDDEGRRLLEAYLDRTLGPDWRERAEPGTAHEQSAGGRHRRHRHRTGLGTQAREHERRPHAE